MKNYFAFLFIAFLTLACDSNNFNNRNPYIPNYNFSETINLNLPAYSQLRFASNAAFVPTAGALGVIIFNTGSGFRAYDAACPNQTLAPCSQMSISGINAICPCDDVSYSLFTGIAQGMEYPMKPYRVEQNGDVLRVYN
jgi:nitrite reductase/ring-hydroxylating ferredoxin subunit